MEFQTINDVFNNREIAIIIWLVPVILYLILSKRMRPATFGLIKAFFQRRLITIQVLAWVYISVITILMRDIGLWNSSMLKDTLIWTFITSFYLIMKAFDKQKKSHFKHLLIDLVKIVSIFEFIANIYTFSLITEVILFPILVFIVAILAYSETDDQYKIATNFLTSLLAVFGLFVLGYSIFQISIHFSEISVAQVGLNYLLPIWMTIAFIPFIYAVLLYDAYHQVFIAVDFKVGHRDQSLAKYLKRKLFFRHTFNFWAIQKKRKEIRASYLTSKKEIDSFLK